MSYSDEKNSQQENKNLESAQNTGEDDSKEPA
jgi:hypothetical protein